MKSKVIFLRKLLILAFIFLFISCPVTAGVIHGTADLFYGAWDFSDSTYVDLDEADMFLKEVHDPNWGFVCIISSFTGSMFTSIWGTSFEDLEYAPADTSIYESIIEPCYPIYPSPCIHYIYVIRTPDNHYAKFRIISPSANCSYCIEYVYQPDGTRKLSDKIPVKQTTLGRIKVLFQ